MTAMAVLHVTQTTVGGVPQVVRSLVHDQLRRGMKVSVACPPEGRLWEEVLSSDAMALAWSAGRSPGPSVVPETWRLSRLVRRVKPDIVHLHSSKAGLAGRLAIRGHRPTVFQPHAWSFLATSGPVRHATEHWERAAVRWTHALAVVSVDERVIGERAGVHGPWVTLRNGVDVQQRLPVGDEERAAYRRELGLEGGPVVVCVGRLARQKGQDILLDAWPAVRAAVPAARLVFVGDGPDRATLSGRAGSNVIFAGEQGNADPWLKAADVVVIPSRFEAGLSLVAMEAMAFARCVVASDVAGMREGMADGAGAIVAVDDHAALTRALVARLLDPALAEREGRAARSRVEHEYDLGAALDRTVALYQRLVEGR
jgi:glycosyltransferase involved in cell wall biosynthesis